MRLILSGGGSGEQTKELDKRFAKFVDKSKPLLYIPIAIDDNKHPYNECLDWLRSTFEKLGISKYDVLTEEKLEAYSKKDVEEFGGIYIGGGSTPYLLKKLKESGMWNFLQEAINKDMPIFGGSAGAIIFSKSIKPSLNFDKNDIKLKNLEGMNLIKDHFLFCHFNEEKEPQIKEIIATQSTSPAILLQETSGLSIIDDKISSIGDAWIIDKEGSKKSFNGL